METEKPVFTEPEEIRLIDYVNVMLKRRWLIVAGTLLCVILAGVISKIMPPVFTASAKFLPSKNPEMASRMGTLIGTAGRIESIEDNLTADYYTEILKSASFLEGIARMKFSSKKFGEAVDLMNYYDTQGNSESERLLKTTNIIGGNLQVSSQRTTSVVTISYSTSEPRLSAAIVNAFLEELIRHNQDIRDTKAKQNRIFIEKQFEENRKLLKDAEEKLANFTAKNKKIVTPDLEVELDRLKRNVKVQEEVYVMLKKQLELAKIEEQEKKPVIEIIQKALPPLHKSKPRTKLNIIIAGFLSLFLFTVVAFVIEFFSKMNPDEEGYREFHKHLKDIKSDLSIVKRIRKKNKG